MNKNDSDKKPPHGYYTHKRALKAGSTRIYRGLKQDLKESRLDEYYSGFADEADKGISLGDILCCCVAFCILPVIPMAFGFMVMIWSL